VRGWTALFACALLLACGETRRSIGEECLRDEDCLSGTCSAQECAAAPVLVTGTTEERPDEEPRIPVSEGGAAVDGG
jgi:hypothetical protein